MEDPSGRVITACGANGEGSPWSCRAPGRRPLQLLAPTAPLKMHPLEIKLAATSTAAVAASGRAALSPSERLAPSSMLDRALTRADRPRRTLDLMRATRVVAAAWFAARKR